MPIEFDEVRTLKLQYEDLYRSRHEAFRMLRKVWHGDYWKLADYETSRPITSVFRDLTAHMSDIGPEIKLVYNVIQMVCNKYQTFLSPLPQIRVWVDPPETDTRRAQATRKQRFLYGCWAMGNMSRVFNNIGWYLPLMGDCYLGIWPDFDKHLPTPLVRSPEFAYPIPSFDKHGETAVIFSWKVNETVVSKNFVEYQAPIEQLRANRRGIFRRGQAPDPQVEILEYSDDNEWHRWLVNNHSDRGTDMPLGQQEVNGVVHNFGFNLFEHLKFIEVPDEPFGHGAVEQALNLNEMGNALYSLLFQAVIENVFPRLVLENPAAAPEEIEAGPGAVIPLNAGGKAYFLQPEGPMIQGQAEFVRTNELNMRNAMGMPGVNFGESPATSIVTGKAVNELQGAGTGSMIEMVQGVGIGDGIVAWNEKAITIAQRMFRDDPMFLHGAQYKSSLDLVPQRFALTLKGKDLVGSPHNEVIFSPAIAPHEKLVMWLQAKGGGLVSDRFIREQIGIPDNDAMVEEIIGEAVEQAVIGGILQQFQAQPNPQDAEQVENEAFAYLQGKTPSPAGAPHPLTQIGAPPASPAGPAGAGAPPQAGPPAPPASPAAQPAPSPAQGAPQAAQTRTLTVDQVAAAIQAVQGIQGKVYLIGEIVQRGQTQAGFEVAITNPADQQTLASALPQYRGRMSFIHVDGKPSERFVDVTPGGEITPGGGGPGNPQALSGVFQS